MLTWLERSWPELDLSHAMLTYSTAVDVFESMAQPHRLKSAHVPAME